MSRPYGAPRKRAFAALAPHGKVSMVAGSGHNIYRDAPAVSVQAVQQVLAQLH